MFSKIVQATIAASLIATPMIGTSAQAQSRQQERQVTTIKQRPNGTLVKKTTTVRRESNNRAWRKGQRFDRRYAANYRVVDYRQYRGRHLYAPPRGHQWVRSGNDAVLVAIGSGIVAAVLANALR